MVGDYMGRSRQFMCFASEYIYIYIYIYAIHSYCWHISLYLVSSCISRVNIYVMGNANSSTEGPLTESILSPE